jgi:hypothetical protein
MPCFASAGTACTDRLEPSFELPQVLCSLTTEIVDQTFLASKEVPGSHYVEGLQGGGAVVRIPLAVAATLSRCG